MKTVILFWKGWQIDMHAGRYCGFQVPITRGKSEQIRPSTDGYRGLNSGGTNRQARGPHCRYKANGHIDWKSIRMSKLDRISTAINLYTLQSFRFTQNTKRKTSRPSGNWRDTRRSKRIRYKLVRKVWGTGRLTNWLTGHPVQPKKQTILGRNAWGREAHLTELCSL